MEKELFRYKSYFDIDLAIKKQIYDLSINGYLTNEEIIKYSDSLYDSVSDFQNKFFEICRLFEMSQNIFTAVYNFMGKIRERIVNTNYTSEDLKRIYNDCFASMSEKTIKEIRKNIYGDSTVYDMLEEWIIIDILNSCSSVNELLHFFHSYVINNLDMLRAIPEIMHKKSIGGYITLRGNVNGLSKEIYDTFDSNIDAGTTDIVSINENKILIMVRDRGHALQIETEEKNDKEIGVYYFIPKVILPDMIDGLKGLSKVQKGDTFAYGSFVALKKEAASLIFEVVKGVPTDNEYIEYRQKTKKII